MVFQFNSKPHQILAIGLIFTVNSFTTDSISKIRYLVRSVMHGRRSGGSRGQDSAFNSGGQSITVYSFQMNSTIIQSCVQSFFRHSVINSLNMQLFLPIFCTLWSSCQTRWQANNGCPLRNDRPYPAFADHSDGRWQGIRIVVIGDLHFRWQDFLLAPWGWVDPRKENWWDWVNEFRCQIHFRLVSFIVCHSAL